MNPSSNYKGLNYLIMIDLQLCEYNYDLMGNQYVRLTVISYLFDYYRSNYLSGTRYLSDKMIDLHYLSLLKLNYTIGILI